MLVRPTVAIVCSIASILFWITTGNWFTQQIRWNTHYVCTSNTYSWIPKNYKLGYLETLTLNTCRRLIDSFFIDEPGCVAARYIETKVLSVMRWTNIMFVTSVFTIIVSQINKILRNQQPQQVNLITTKVVPQITNPKPPQNIFHYMKRRYAIEVSPFQLS